MMTWKSDVATAFDAFTDFLYPPECVLCHTPGQFVCATCLSAISPIEPPYCPVCGYPGASRPAECSQCQRFPLMSLDAIRSAAMFDEGALRTLIHKFKYEYMRVLGKSLAPLLAACYTIHQMNTKIIVPVPLHKSRQKFRGYNQSAELAKALSGNIGIPVDTATLVRYRKTKTQMELNAVARQANVAGAFVCTSDVLAGQSVLLIDDVCTTGATLDACASALKKSGVISVSALTLGRAA